MMAEPGLREAYLAEHSPFHELLDNQVLSVHRRPKWAFPASLDEEYVAFSMDRIFQFLLILRVFERYEGGMEEFLETGLPKIVEAARAYPSLRSGLVDLLAEVARNTQPTDAQKRRAFTQLCAVSDGGGDPWMRDLLSEVLLALADEAVYEAGESAQERDPFLLVIDLILGSLGERAAPLFSATVTALFVRALWEAAIILLRRQAESPDLGEALRFRVQNQLVVVLKNQDEWGDAQRYSDQNDEILPRIEDPALQARHWLNRFSVYYDLGRRPYALDLCERANRLAKAHHLPLEEAATANNLGIAYVYFDRPGDAVRVLSEGIAAARDSDIVAGHNYLNRGLVRMVEWQLRGGTALARAEEDIAEASRRFQATGYTQGILYGNASLGLIRMYEALKLKASFTGRPPAEWPRPRITRHVSGSSTKRGA
jgi:tetratricopeptide (TPR) repeat protein